MNALRCPRTFCLSGGFGAGAGLGILADSAVYGELDWRGAALYALGVAAGVLIGFPVWRRAGRRLGSWFDRRTRNAILLGLAAGIALVLALWAWWSVQSLPAPGAAPWLPDAVAAMVLGLWNAFLLGIGWGGRF